MVVSRDVTVGGQRPVLDPDLLAGGNVPLAAVEVLADPVGDAGLDISVHDSPPSPDNTLARRPVPRPAFRQARRDMAAVHVGCHNCVDDLWPAIPRIGQCSSAPHPRSRAGPVRDAPACGYMPRYMAGIPEVVCCLPAAVFVLPF